MREIKFRAWDELDRKMSIWTLNDLLVNFGYSEINDRPSPFFDYMQYTGLKDKNGKEIYENDVILLKDKDYDEKNETAQALATYEFHCVEFKDGCFKIGGINLGDYVDSKYLDIIQCGNIYENKEVYRVQEKIFSHVEDMNITDITFNISNKK